MRFAARNYRYFAGWADKLQGDSIPLARLELVDFTTREPRGSANIVFADADLKQAVIGAVAGIFCRRWLYLHRRLAAVGAARHLRSSGGAGV
ncbi:hypothetical protein [Vreelandella venusta]|uniref:hypothetical protein n=1 Tax=Vreelandella venusta TaxID=44935 RepID=UPI00197AFC42|nr:hypothetical protein [Halomonas venusta]